jgi:hypothetical protein
MTSYVLLQISIRKQEIGGSRALGTSGHTVAVAKVPALYIGRYHLQDI